MKNENIGYVNDFTTCRGVNGTDLKTIEEEEITKELEEKWS